MLPSFNVMICGIVASLALLAATGASVLAPQTRAGIGEMPELSRPMVQRLLADVDGSAQFHVQTLARRSEELGRLRELAIDNAAPADPPGHAEATAATQASGEETLVDASAFAPVPAATQGANSGNSGNSGNSTNSTDTANSTDAANSTDVAAALTAAVPPALPTPAAQPVQSPLPPPPAALPAQVAAIDPDQAAGAEGDAATLRGTALASAAPDVQVAAPAAEIPHEAAHAAPPAHAHFRRSPARPAKVASHRTSFHEARQSVPSQTVFTTFAFTGYNPVGFDSRTFKTKRFDHFVWYTSFPNRTRPFR